MLKKYNAVFIGALSFLYYIFLSAKTYTWLYSSGDSGDWLAASNMWIVPQPFGSPLYILLGHLVNSIEGNLPVLMTVLLSCLPSAITVALVYLITKHFTNKDGYAITASLCLLGCSIFLTQSTILEEYALAVMFTVLGYYFYLKDRKALAVIALGLGSAVHIVVIPITVLWLAVEYKNWRQWFKLIPFYVLFGLVPYMLILWLFTIDTIPFLANGLSLEALNAYTGSSSVVGTLSLFDSPERLLAFVSLIIMSFGLALIPFIKGLNTKVNYCKCAILAILFPMWYYLTCLDPTTWTFMMYACPFIAIFIGIGMSRISSDKLKTAVIIGALLLVILNSVFLNASNLVKTDKYDTAMEYYNELMSLPDGSAVVINRGGFEGMSLFYVISEGKDLIPVFFTNYGYEDNILYQNYLEWINYKYQSDANNTEELADYFIQQGDVYILYPCLSKWDVAFDWQDTGLDHFKLVTDVYTDVIVHTEENRHNVD